MAIPGSAAQLSLTPSPKQAPASTPALTPLPAVTPSPISARPPSPSPALTPPMAQDLTRIAGKVKGTLLIARVKFLRSRGAVATERVMKRLSADDRSALESMLLPSSWYPAGVLLRLEMTAAAILSNGDRRQLLREMGRFTAETNLSPSGVHRPFVREGDPHFLLENLPKLYGSQHSNGHRSCERTGPAAVTVRHFDTGDAEPDDCLTTAGWLQRAVEISGGHAVTVDEMQCRGRGAPHCEFRVAWKQ